MRNAVEEGPDIKIQNPVLLPAASTCHSQRVLGRTPRTVAVTVGMKDRLQPHFQQHRCCGLCHSIGHVRHPERSDPSPMIIRYLHRPHRPRQVTARGHSVPQLVEVVPLPLPELRDVDRVHARRSLVAPDLHPRLVDEALVDLKRLHRRLWSTRRLLPHRGWPPSDLTCPAPSLQPHYRAFSTTTGRSAPVPGIGTLAPADIAARGSPLDAQPASAAHRVPDDRFSCSMPAPTMRSRHLYTGHHQSNTQTALWLRTHRWVFVPEIPTTPGFGATIYVSMRRQWFTHVRLLIAYLTR